MTAMNDLRVAIIQDDISWQDPAANRERYQAHFDGIGDTDLVVLPEFYSTGFYTDPSEKFETMGGATVAWMSACAAELDAVITGSVVMKVEELYVNRMLWARPDGSLDWYDKRHLFRFGGEHHNYSGGHSRVIFGHCGWRIALFICYDVRFPVWSRNTDDYDLALYVANWPDARQYAWDTLVRARAIENQAYVLAVNRLGDNPNGDSYSGGSVILDFLGKPIEDCQDQAAVASATLSASALAEFREFFPASMDQDGFTIHH
jgi:predicted amidohydrolase